MFSAAFGHSFCMTTRMPKPSLAMISADSWLPEEAKNPSSGSGRRRNRMAVELGRQREQGADAEGLGEIAHRQVVGNDRHVGAAGLGQHVERYADFHDGSPRLYFARARFHGCGCPGALARRV